MPELNPLRAAFFTDLYELTMAQAYHAEGFDQPAVFELFFRTLPPGQNFVVAAGLDDVLAYLEGWHVSDREREWLRTHGAFSREFVEWLGGLRFTGDVFAVPEGTLVFPNEPLLQVVAPIVEAQIVETFVLNQVHLQSVVATKAARVLLAARGRTVVDFGSRRAHGTDAAMKVARTSYLVGCAGTSNVLAGLEYGIPTFGTMAHSYIQAHDDEFDSFDAFARLTPETTLLVDTYDTLAGVEKVIELSQRLGAAFRVRAIRLDSGDLAALAKESRRRLDEAGLTAVRIFASSGLDEFKIHDLLEAGAPIDGFGVGTNLAVADGAAQLDMVYKLVEYAGRPRIKLSSQKVLFPGRKQIFRTMAGDRMESDVIGRHDEDLPGTTRVRPVMRGGQRLPDGRVPLDESRRHAADELTRLPERLRAFEAAHPPYSVRFSDGLQNDLSELRRRLDIEAGG